MRLTSKYLLWTVAAVGWGLLAFAAMFLADRLIGRTTPFTPAAVSAVFMSVWILLQRRYGPRGQPRDPRQQRVWLLVGLAASGSLAVAGLLAAEWMTPSNYPVPQCSKAVRVQTATSSASCVPG